MRNRLEFTRQLVSQLPPGSWTVDQARLAWWYNVRENGGMRLTSQGYKVFVKDLELEHYEFALPKDFRFNQRTVLALDRKLQTPYFLKKENHKLSKIIFFGSRDAVLANLYGDLEKFLENYG